MLAIWARMATATFGVLWPVHPLVLGDLLRV